MAETQYLFQLYRGDDFVLRVAITDTDGNPVDITGWAFQLTMKLSPEESDSEAPVKVNSNPISPSVGPTGVVHLHLPAEQTKRLLPTVYWVDIQRYFGKMTTTIVVSKAKVLPDVTHRRGL